MNIGEWIGKRAIIAPDKPFLTDKNKTHTNRQFNRRVNQTAHALRYLGVNKGMRVALLMSNGGEYLEILFACAKTGVIVVPLDVRLAVRELLDILRDSEPALLVYSAEWAANVSDLRAAGAEIPAIFRQGEAADSPDLSWTDVVDGFEFDEPVEILGVDLADPLLLIYKAGAAGGPRGAVLSHRNVLFGAVHSLLGYGIDRFYKSLIVAPLFHVGALAASVMPIVYAGGSLVLNRINNPPDILNVLCAEKINYMFAAPVLFQMMMETPEWKDADLSTVRFFSSGGATVSLAVLRKYQDEKGVGFIQGYAQTETGRFTSLDPEDAVRKAGSIGKEVFHANLRILGEHNLDAPPMTPGEILVQGPTVFSGYWKKEEATRAVLNNGWFHTGILGRRDAEGYLYIAGRKEESSTPMNLRAIPAKK